MAPAVDWTRRTPLRWTHLLQAALFSIGACNGDALVLPQDMQPAAMAILAGDGQADTVGRPLPDSLVVRITDRGDRPIIGQPVHFINPVGGTGARAVPETAHTDADGRAAVSLVLGTHAGPTVVRAQVDASTGALAADFHAVAIAAAPDTLFAVTGDTQTGVVGGELNQPLVGMVADRYGNAVGGVTVTWTVDGGGSVSPAVSVTDNLGRLTTVRTLGPAPGSQRAVATTPGLRGSPLVFTQMASEGLPASLLVQSGNNQTAAPGQALALPLVVRLVDALGNGIPGRAVTWPVATGGGTIVALGGTTDAGGRASATWTLGPVAGTNIVIPSSSGLTAIITATGSASPATKIAASSPTQLTGTAGGPASSMPSVLVTDAQGRPVAGVLVTFAVTGGSGSVAPATATTNDAGGATVTLWTLGPLVGSNTLRASAAGPSGALSGSPVVFTAAAMAGPVSRLAIVTQPSTTGTSGVALAQPPVLQLQDANGNGVGTSGIVISAAITGNPVGALLNVTSATTTVSGNASFAGLAITAPGATYTLQFSSASLPLGPTSNAIVISGAPATIAMAVQPSASLINGAVLPVQPSAEVRDQFGAPVVGAPVTATVASGGGTLSGQATVSTNTLGVVSFTNLALTGTVGSYTLRLSTGSASVLSTTITLTTGPASAAKATATVPAQGKTGTATPITVQTRDQSGNSLSTGGHTVRITITGKNPVAAFTATDSHDGQYTGSYVPKTKGKDTIAITLDGTPIAGSPYTSDVH